MFKKKDEAEVDSCQNVETGSKILITWYIERKQSFYLISP